MALYTATQFNNHIKEVLVNGGYIPSDTPVDLFYGKDQTFMADIIKDENSYNLLVLHNKINNFYVVILDISAGWYKLNEATTKGSTSCTYKIDVIDHTTQDPPAGRYEVYVRYDGYTVNGSPTGLNYLDQYRWSSYVAIDEFLDHTGVFEPWFTKPYDYSTYGHFIGSDGAVTQNTGGVFTHANMLNNFTSTPDVHDASDWVGESSQYSNVFKIPGGVAGNGSRVAFDYNMTFAQAGDPNSYELIMLESNQSFEAPVENPWTTLELWRNFTKRKNSTKRPSIPGVKYNVLLKHDTSITNPTFILDKQYYDYNYCKYGNRYYYIDDIVSLRNDAVELVCHIDYYATWKNEIKATSAFVERATSTGDYMIPDKLNPPTTDIISERTPLFDLGSQSADFLSYAQGKVQARYILAVASDNGVKHFYMEPTRLETLMDVVFTDQFFQNLTSDFYDMKSCLLSLKRVPYKFTGDQADYNTSIHVGGKDTLVPGGLLKDNDFFTYDSSWVTVGYPSVTETGKSKSYVDFAPYTSVRLHLPFIGLVDIDPAQIGESKKIRVRMYCDPITADITYSVLTQVGNVDLTIAEYTGNCGSNMPMAGQANSAEKQIMAFAGGLAGVAAGAASGNAIATLGSAAAGIWGIVEGSKLKTQTNGSISSMLGAYIDNAVWVEVDTQIPVSWDLDVNKNRVGIPLGKTVALSDMVGYVQTAGAQVEMAGTQEEKDAVNSGLDSGLFIE